MSLTRPSIDEPLNWRPPGLATGAVRNAVVAIAPFLITTTALIALWQYASVVLNPLFFPSPLAVAAAARELILDGTLAQHVGISLARILTGFVIGTVVAVPIGLLMGMYPFAARFMTPYVGFLRFVPPISMMIFAIAWFGSGEVSKVFLVFFSTVFIIVLGVEAGVRNIAPNRIRGARCLGANPVQLFLHVLLPSSAPFVLTSMRIAMGNAFAVIVAAEMLSSEQGIGYLLESSRVFLQTNRIFVAIVTLGIMGFVTDRCFRLLISRFGGAYVR